MAPGWLVVLAVEAVEAATGRLVPSVDLVDSLVDALADIVEVLVLASLAILLGTLFNNKTKNDLFLASGALSLESLFLLSSLITIVSLQ